MLFNETRLGVSCCSCFGETIVVVVVVFCSRDEVCRALHRLPLKSLLRAALGWNGEHFLGGWSAKGG